MQLRGVGVCGGGEAGVHAADSCSRPGTPQPQVTWRKGPSSEPLRSRPGLAVLDEGSLFLASVAPSDGGDYECQATNEAGSASRRAKLVVLGERGPAGQRAPTSAGAELTAGAGVGRLRAAGERQAAWHPFPREAPQECEGRAPSALSGLEVV